MPDSPDQRSRDFHRSRLFANALIVPERVADLLDY